MRLQPRSLVEEISDGSFASCFFSDAAMFTLIGCSWVWADCPLNQLLSRPPPLRCSRITRTLLGSPQLSPQAASCSWRSCGSIRDRIKLTVQPPNAPALMPYIQSEIVLSGTRTESPFLTDVTQLGELNSAPVTSSPSKSTSASHMCSLRGAPSASFPRPSQKGALTQARSKPGTIRRRSQATSRQK